MIGKGTLDLASGDKYVGEWKGDDKHGKGIYYYKNGDRFEGEWENNKKKGKGTYYYIKNEKKRIGEYLDNKEIGEHIVYHPNGKITKKNY